MDVAKIARCFGFLVCGGVFAQSPVLHLAPGISAPFVLAKSKPVYTDEARLAKVEGSVLLSVTVDADGQPGDIQVDRPLGLGLDDSAIDNVRHWKFKPGTKAGMPVAVRVNEEVFFRPQRTLWDWHVVRAIFHPPDGAARPVLIQTKFPATVDQEENASVTLGFDVGPQGIPMNLRMLKSSNPKWEAQVIAAVREGWRFRPGTIGTKSVSVPAWFELVRGSHSPIPPAPIPAR